MFYHQNLFLLLLDDVIPQPPPNMVANGTYVIRKGRKERQRLFDIESFQTFTPPDIISDNHAPKEEEDDEDSDEKPEAAAAVLSFRHSIDLAIPTPALYPPHSPRYFRKPTPHIRAQSTNIT